jgi:hypothetical protein
VTYACAALAALGAAVAWRGLRHAPVAGKDEGDA